MGKIPLRNLEPAGEGKSIMVRAANEALRRDVAERLSLTRDVLGLTQKEFAERAGMGSNAYSMCETGERPLHVEDAIRLCEAFKLTLDFLYRGDISGLKHELATSLEALQRARKVAAEVMADFRAHPDRRRRRRLG